MEALLVGFVCLTAGVFCIVCAAMDYDFFMNDKKAWIFVKLLGRNGARVFYVIVGAAFVVAGVLFAAGIITNKDDHRAELPAAAPVVATLGQSDLAPSLF